MVEHRWYRDTDWLDQLLLFVDFLHAGKSSDKIDRLGGGREVSLH